MAVMRWRREWRRRKPWLDCAACQPGIWK